MNKENILWVSRLVMTWIAFITFLGLIVFTVVYTTLKGQPTQWYWGLIGLLVGGVVIAIKWFFKK